MAYALTKRGSQDNVLTYEFICDTAADMNAIENKYRTLGSVAIVLQSESDAMEAYICGSDHEWRSLTTIGGGTGAAGGGLSIHICTNEEIANGLPDVEEPDEFTFYLVPAANSANGDIYDEYIYVNEAWEKFSGTRIDLSGYALKANPEFTNSISFNRMPNSTIGSDSIALGLTGGAATASGSGAIALGGSTASALQSFAVGPGATASSYGASAIGFHAAASNQYAHATGSRTTASGVASMTGGYHTVANHASQYALGQCNVADTSSAAADARGTYIEIIGNGADTDNRSNARTLDWFGNEYLKGDLYVGCDANSAHGTKLARISAPPSEDGTYTLQATVSSGTITYTWVAGV